MKNPTQGTSQTADAGPAGAFRQAWALALPLLIWLALANMLLAMNLLFGAPSQADLLSPLRWLWQFISLRMLCCVLLAVLIQRHLFPRRRWTAVPMAIVMYLALAVVVGALKHDMPMVERLTGWTNNGVEQLYGMTIGIWREAITTAWITLAFALILWAAPARAHAWTVRLLQAVVVVLCALVGVALVYDIVIGQPASVQILGFAITEARDMVRLVRPEVTPLRVVFLSAGVFIALGWFWRRRRADTAESDARPHPFTWGAAATALLALAVLLPVPSSPALAYDRTVQGVLLSLAKTAITSPITDVQSRAFHDFVQTGGPRWQTADLSLRPQAGTPPRNVVLVMMESVRADSTTMHNAALQTTPYLKSLAEKGLMVADMSAVIPRTTSAWLAILAGQYPLVDQGFARWMKVYDNKPELGSLPHALGRVGYRSAFFTTTNLVYQSDEQVIHAMGFDTVKSEPDLSFPGAERVTYFGIADEHLLKPILDWSEDQHKSGRPFFATVMTNVGHHDFRTPSNWPKKVFDPSASPVLYDYYNCLSYIDDVMRRLVEGYTARGMLQDTVFVFVGDHGQMLGEHNTNQSFNALYQKALHVPMVIYAPGMHLPPGVVTGPRQQIDILPTIAELAGFEVQGGALPGISLLQPVDPERKLYFSGLIDWSYLAMRKGQRKYIYNFERSPMTVFDLAHDPQELSPLTDVAPAELAQMREDMLRWRIDSEIALMARRDTSVAGRVTWEVASIKATTAEPRLAPTLLPARQSH